MAGRLRESSRRETIRRGARGRPIGRLLQRSRKVPRPGDGGTPSARPHDHRASRIGLSEDQRIIHVLTASAMAPRPGDLERVKEIGLAAYVDRQLDPGRIPDDRLRRPSAFPALTMNVHRALHQLSRARSKLLAKLNRGDEPAGDTAAGSPRAAARRISVELQRPSSPAPCCRAAVQEVMVDFWFNHFNVDARKGAVKWMIADYEPRPSGRTRWASSGTSSSPPPSTRPLFYLDTGCPPRPTWSCAPPQRGRQMGLTRTTPARSWSCTPWAWTAAIPRRTLSTWRAPSPAVHRPAARARNIRVRLPPTIRVRSASSDTSSRPGWRGGRCARHRDPGAASVDGPLHRHQAGAALRERRSAARPRGARGQDLS